MAKSTGYKSVVVKEDPKTSLAEAGIHPLTVNHGGRVVAFAHAYFPYHDRALHELILQYLRDTRPAVVFLLGGMVDENAFKSLCEQEDNYLHDFPEAPEVQTARLAGGFEEQILSLGKDCGDYIKSFAEASGGTVIYVPSATHLSMGNEVRLMEAIQRKKKVLDAWSANHCDMGEIAQDLASELLGELTGEPSEEQVKALSTILDSIGLKPLLGSSVPVSEQIASILKENGLELPSDPMVDLPKKLAKLFQIDNVPNIHVLRYGASAKLNDKTLFMIGDFRRRHAGDSSQVEWEQRGCNIVKSFDGKAASSWATRPKHTLPTLTLDHYQYHEIGYLWDVNRMGHYRDYDRRCPGFWSGVVRHNELFGEAIFIMAGNDGRRSFIDDHEGGFLVYTEETPGALPHGEEIKLLADDTASAPAVEPPTATKAARHKKAGRAKPSSRTRRRKA